MTLVSKCSRVRRPYPHSVRSLKSRTILNGTCPCTATAFRPAKRPRRNPRSRKHVTDNNRVPCVRYTGRPGRGGNIRNRGQFVRAATTSGGVGGRIKTVVSVRKNCRYPKTSIRLSIGWVAISQTSVRLTRPVAQQYRTYSSARVLHDRRLINQPPETRTSPCPDTLANPAAASARLINFIPFVLNFSGLPLPRPSACSLHPLRPILIYFSFRLFGPRSTPPLVTPLVTARVFPPQQLPSYTPTVRQRNGVSVRTVLLRILTAGRPNETRLPTDIIVKTIIVDGRNVLRRGDDHNTYVSPGRQLRKTFRLFPSHPVRRPTG